MSAHQFFGAIWSSSSFIERRLIGLWKRVSSSCERNPGLTQRKVFLFHDWSGRMIWEMTVTAFNNLGTRGRQPPCDRFLLVNYGCLKVYLFLNLISNQKPFSSWSWTYLSGSPCISYLQPRTVYPKERGLLWDLLDSDMKIRCPENYTLVPQVNDLKLEITCIMNQL